MKILLINTVDTEGGAAKAAYRLHQGLGSVGMESSMFVMQKKSGDYKVLGSRSNSQKLLSMLRPYIDSVPVLLYRPKVKPVWSTNWFPNHIYSRIEKNSADIINVHWIGGGFVNLSLLTKIERPIVWTLHDMWAFTGGCHYAGDCQKYETICGVCPQLESRFRHDLSRCLHNKKRKAYGSVRNMTVVSPSRWLAECAGKSSLLRDFRIEVIPNGIDHKLYRPLDKKLSRDILGLPEDKRLILFGAVDATTEKRKGFHLLVPALKKLSGRLKDAELVVFGASKPKEQPDLGFRTNYMGTLHDDTSLVLLYSAADVVVVPSIQDNLPNAVLEAFACGTPVVAFNIGGIPDMIEHEKNGYLAKPYEPEDLAGGMEWVLQDEVRLAELSRMTRKKAEEEFSLELQARRYIDLYQDILGRK